MYPKPHKRRYVCSALTFCLVAGMAYSAGAEPPRARTLKYDSDRSEWVETPPPLPGTAEGDVHAIRLQIKAGEFRKALKSIKRFVAKYGEADPQYPAILIAKAEASIGRKDYYKAHEVLQEFLNLYAGMDLTSEALRLEFVVAETYLTGVKRKVWGIRLFSGVDLAYQILDEISVDYPETRWAQYAIKTKADHMFREGEHDLAEMEYARLLREYPRSQYHQPAMRRTAEAALASFRGTDYDESALIEADERYRDYRSFYPAAADRDDVALILDGIREQRAEKDYSIGRYYERIDHLSSAVFYYRHVVGQWPDTMAASKAQKRLDLLGV